VLDDLRADATHPPSVVVRDVAARAGGLVLRVAPLTTPAAGARADTAARWLASLEVLDAAAVRFVDGRVRRGRAGRARVPVAPLAARARLSDLLVVRPGLAALPTPTLEAAADSALGVAEVRAGAPIGLFWEQYDASTPGGAADTVVVRATRLAPTIRERLGALVGRPIVLGAVRARYAVSAAGGGATGRAVALTWPDVPPGPYRLEVTVPARPGVPEATSAVVVRVGRER
jgi:hypothetical protein